MGDASEFGGRIGRYRADSEAWWPQRSRPPEGAPNLLVVVLDDVGFAQLGCFGSDIETPNIDRLAVNGLRFSNFHTTALCSPTRACVLTGRNHHSVGMGRITDLATGFPGYDADIPRSAAMLPAMLVPHGYAAYAVGKWHLTPDEQTHLGAPRRSWPLGRGFERWYGFFHGETSQFAPALCHDNHRIPPPASWEDGYHLTEDLADRAIEFVGDLRNVEPDQPFLLYLATGACHSPHQAPPSWIEHYRGRFDEGWDVWREATARRQVGSGLLPEGTELSPRPAWVPAWDSLSVDERRLYARYMECFAAFLSHTDAQIGRVLDFLATTGDLDDTVVMLLSDNGASSEGGPTGSINDARPWNLAERPLDEALAQIDDIGGPWIHNNYPWGWTVAGNTPFRRWKREVHEGGVCDPLIVSWPAGIAARGEVRRQYVHAIDLVPTLLELVGVEPPDVVDGIEQQPVEGVSFASTFDSPEAGEVRSTQYYEMFGCRAIYHEGWKAVTYVSMMEGQTASDDDPWELYHVAIDPTECHDLAGDEPERLAEMVARWWEQAERHQVLPVDSQPFFEAIGRPGATPPRGRYVYHPGTGPVEEVAAVDLRGRSHTITAIVELDDDGASGVVVQQGSGHGGFVLRLDDGHVTYVHNYVALEWSQVRDANRLRVGRHELRVRFDRDPATPMGGTLTLVVDGEERDRAAVPRFTPTRWSITGDGLTVGYSASLPVTRDYRSPHRFTGRIGSVTVDVAGEPRPDAMAEARQALRRQ
ncbi:MAG TPA: arylsulfatase [Microthrixaceae bacterium]|nr:arylsulfatase [Microthrixaceae bacterium]